jgi:hypothetical protein
MPAPRVHPAARHQSKALGRQSLLLTVNFLGVATSKFVCLVPGRSFVCSQLSSLFTVMSTAVFLQSSQQLVGVSVLSMGAALSV